MKRQKSLVWIGGIVAFLVLSGLFISPPAVQAVLNIPANATVTSATLSLHVIETDGATVHTHRILTNWDEMAVTWSNFGAADYVPADIGTFSAAPGVWKTVDVTSLVQSWINGTFPNYGVLLDEVAPTSFTTFESSEAVDTTLRPKLEVCYTAPGVPATCVTIQRPGASHVDVLDAWIWQKDPNTNYGDNPLLYVGILPNGNGVKKTLIRFDINVLHPAVTIVKRTNGQLATDPNGTDVPQITPGATVTWLYTVTNTGSVAVSRSSVAVTDNQAGVTPVFDVQITGNADLIFDPGEVLQFKAVGTAANLLLPPPGVVTTPNGCTKGGTLPPHNAYVNIGTVTIPGATASAPSSYCNPPAIQIVKRTNGQLATDPNGTDVPQITPGATVTWLYTVTNTGSVGVPRSSVVVTDSQTGVTPVFDVQITGNADLIFDPGEVLQFKAVGTAANLLLPPPGVVTTPNGCTKGGTLPPHNAYVNIGTVTIPGATASAPSSYCNTPDVQIVKRTNDQLAIDPDGTDVPQIKAGDPVTWTYFVTNIGVVPINKADVVVTDNQAGVTPLYDAIVTGNGDAILDPNEVWRYKAIGVAVNLSAPPAGVITVPGVCTLNHVQTPRTAYVNIGTVTIPGVTKSAPSSYCNPLVSAYKLFGPTAFGQVKSELETKWQLALGYEDLPLVAGLNDFDYNDWTVDVGGTNNYDPTNPGFLTTMRMDFLPHSRGATFDHRFQIIIPPLMFMSNGSVVLNIYDKNHALISTTTTPFTGAVGGTYVIFPKTSDALPGNFVNTNETAPHVAPQRFADLTFHFTTPFPFTVNVNNLALAHGTGLFFDPDLTVLNTGEQVHIGDLRMLAVPSTDYLWPEERVRIDKAFPDITFIPGSIPDFAFPNFWWTHFNNCVFDGVACALP